MGRHNSRDFHPRSLMIRPSGVPRRLRRGVLSLVASLGAITAVAVTSIAAPTSDGSLVDRRAVSCRTDSAGTCAVRHLLGVVPTSVLVTPRISGRYPSYELSVVAGSETAEAFRVLAVRDDGHPMTNRRIRFVYQATGELVDTPPTPTSATTSGTTFTLKTSATTSTPTATATSATTTSSPEASELASRATESPSDGASGPVCGTAALDGGPSTPPDGAVSVPAGDNRGIDFQRAGATYWFAPGTHMLGSDRYSQIAPGDGASFVGAPGAVIDGQGINNYAFSGGADQVTLKHLTIRNFVTPMNEGTIAAGTNWTMEYLTVEDNKGSGIYVNQGSRLRRSCVARSGQAGLGSYHPVKGAQRDIVVDGNEFVGNNTGDWEAQIPGCGCTAGVKFWDAHDVTVTNNWIHDNRSVGLWVDQNNYNMVIEGNLIEDNDAFGIFYETSYNAMIKGNVLRRNAIVIGRQRQAAGDRWPIGAIFISEAGFDSRVPVPAGVTSFRVEGNLFEDNWGGVVLWENANRFCNSPANTSTGYCTLVGKASLEACSPGSIESEPLYSDCRWKTQNVRVVGNTFRLRSASLGDCKVDFCGVSGLFSNWGSWPDWSPYRGDVIQQAITFDQNNVWANNIYVGPWRWVVKHSDMRLTFDEWRAAPYGQDAGSST